MTKKKPHGHNAGGSSKQKRRKENKENKKINKNKYIFYIYSEYPNNYFLPNCSLYRARHQCSLH